MWHSPLETLCVLSSAFLPTFASLTFILSVHFQPRFVDTHVSHPFCVFQASVPQMFSRAFSPWDAADILPLPEMLPLPTASPLFPLPNLLNFANFPMVGSIL